MIAWLTSSGRKLLEGPNPAAAVPYSGLLTAETTGRPLESSSSKSSSCAMSSAALGRTSPDPEGIPLLSESPPSPAYPAIAARSSSSNCSSSSLSILESSSSMLGTFPASSSSPSAASLKLRLGLEMTGRSSTGFFLTNISRASSSSPLAACSTSHRVLVAAMAPPAQAQRPEKSSPVASRRRALSLRASAPTCHTGHGRTTSEPRNAGSQ
mmetsp:Transcript_79957/g.151958  ORF Transcript_79957/g.151958 Transcript_79957/m.151958 type:complete len:211 (+) Transcript_79957:865-1497(+)